MEHAWPWPRVRAGEWTAAQFFDAGLADAIHDLAALAGTVLSPADNLCHIEPEGRRIRNAFTRGKSSSVPRATPILWDHSTDVQVTMVRVVELDSRNSHASQQSVEGAGLCEVFPQLSPLIASARPHPRRCHPTRRCICRCSRKRTRSLAADARPPDARGCPRSRCSSAADRWTYYRGVAEPHCLRADGFASSVWNDGVDEPRPAA